MIKFYENLFSDSGVIICGQINVAKLIESFSKLVYMGTTTSVFSGQSSWLQIQRSRV
jgi:hypothetical protein